MRPFTALIVILFAVSSTKCTVQKIDGRSGRTDTADNKPAPSDGGNGGSDDKNRGQVTPKPDVGGTGDRVDGGSGRGENKNDGETEPKKGSGGNTKGRDNPAQPKAPAKCETPVVASRDACKKDKRSKLSAACNVDLIKKCVKNNFQDCSDVPTASTEVCKPTAIKKYLKTKPECYTKATTQCRTFLRSDKNKADVKAVIPGNCTSWFDGCNECKVKDGKANGCTQKICSTKDLGFCKQFKDGKKCKKSRVTGKAACDGDGKASDKSKQSQDPCEDILSDFELSEQEVCKKALYKCTDNPAVVESCKIQRREEEVADCSTTKDKAKQRKCCVQDKLSGSKCDAYGSAKTLPSDCKSRCVADGKFKSKDKSCRSCRGAGDVRLEGVTDDNGNKKKSFDPSRVETSIKEVASGLNKGGQQCVKRIATATSLLRTQIQRWRNDPSQAEEITEEVELKSIADIQSEIDKTVDSSKSLENEFEDDTDGENYRNTATGLVLKEKMSDDNKPKNCAVEFTALQKAYNEIAGDYANLPTKLKSDGVGRVELGFEETDIGSTDLSDSKSICAFAKQFVKKVKETEGFHKKRLKAARALVCTKAGAMLKDKLTSNLVNCLARAKRDANQGNDDTAKTDIQDDIDKVNKNGLKRVSKLFRMMKNKCLMKDSSDSQAARVVGAFKSKLKKSIKKKSGGELSLTEKQDIANSISTAVKASFPNASNIVTIFKTTETGRRQLRSRRVLESSIEAETTYDLDAPGDIDESVNVDLGTDFAVVSSDVELEPTSATIEVTDDIPEINADLPSGDEETTTTTTEAAQDGTVDAGTSTTPSSDDPVDDSADSERNTLLTVRADNVEDTTTTTEAAQDGTVDAGTSTTPSSDDSADIEQTTTQTVRADSTTHTTTTTEAAQDGTVDAGTTRAPSSDDSADIEQTTTQTVRADSATDTTTTTEAAQDGTVDAGTTRAPSSDDSADIEQTTTQTVLADSTTKAAQDETADDETTRAPSSDDSADIEQTTIQTVRADSATEAAKDETADDETMLILGSAGHLMVSTATICAMVLVV